MTEPSARSRSNRHPPARPPSAPPPDRGRPRLYRLPDESCQTLGLNRFYICFVHCLRDSRILEVHPKHRNTRPYVSHQHELRVSSSSKENEFGTIHRASDRCMLQMYAIEPFLHRPTVRVRQGPTHRVWPGTARAASALQPELGTPPAIQELPNLIERQLP